jgi:hypothetical protein
MRNFGGSGPISHPPEDTMLQRTTHLTATEIKAAGPFLKELVPSPGPGKMLILHAIQAKLNFLTSAFAAGSAIDVLWGGDTGTPMLPAGITAAFVAAVANRTEATANAEQDVEEASGNRSNQAMNLSLAGAAFTTGLGSMDVTVMYSIVPN